MPVDTRVDGDPDAVRATARWLRDHLAFEVAGGARALSLSRVDAAAGWESVAGSAFHDRMSSAGFKADALRGDITATAGALDELAAHLDDVKQRMRTAREIAAAAGLVVSGERILEPGPAPAVPELPGNNAATPGMVAARDAAIQATAVNAQQWEAYRAATEEAVLARAREQAALEAVRAEHASVLGTPPIRSGDVTAAGHTQTRTGLGISASAGALPRSATGLGAATGAGADGPAGGTPGSGTGFGAAVSGASAGITGALTGAGAGAGAGAGVGATTGGAAAGFAGAAAGSPGFGAAAGTGAGAVAGGVPAGGSTGDDEPSAAKPGGEPPDTTPPSPGRPAAEPEPAPPPQPSPQPLRPSPQPSPQAGSSAA